MLNFSYTFNRNKRNSQNSQLSSLRDASRGLRQKSASNEQNDGRDSWSFRTSAGHIGSESDNRTASSSSGPESPTSVGKLSNTANTSIISHPVIDLNEVQNQTSKFKRSLSYPPQGSQNRNYYDGVNRADHLPYDYSTTIEHEFYNPTENNKHIDKLHSYSFQEKGGNGLNSSRNVVLDTKPDMEKEKRLNLDEVLLRTDQNQNSLINRPRYTGPEFQYLPEASEDLLSRLQLKNSGVFDISSDSDNENAQAQGDNNNRKKKERQNKSLKNGHKKKTYREQ